MQSCSTLTLWCARRTLCSLLFALPLAAEFRSVTIGVSGLECSSCAASVERGLRRLKGVESVSFANNRVAVALKPGNPLPLDELRDTLKGAGFTPGEAKVQARGTLTSDGGKWRFRLAGADKTYRVEAEPSLVKQMKDGAGTPVTVEGVIAAPGDRASEETLRLNAILTGD